MAGLAERDRRVFERCAAAGVPVAVVMSGGYAPDIDDIVEIHTNTIRIAARWSAARQCDSLAASR
jgi:acetoin utilization deacetylase AcuC-like enzyme